MGGGLSAREKIILALLAALLLAGGLWRVLQPAAPGMVRVDRRQDDAAPDEAGPELITVHLVGAVSAPGVYRLPAGSRVYEAVALAGGSAHDADLDRVNLARPLYDGEQVIVYRLGEPPAPGSTKININRATVEELATLPNIGAVRAQRIVEHREKHGPFTEISQIMDVNGIGEGIFKAIEDLITIY
jgi:competence protein ComEA